MIEAQDPKPHVAEDYRPLTPAQKQLVRTSFAKLAPSADAVADAFYRKLFALDPDLRKLFKSDLAQQGRKLMIGSVIANLDGLESIATTLREFGRRHAAYGVEPSDYDTFA